MAICNNAWGTRDVDTPHKCTVTNGVGRGFGGTRLTLGGECVSTKLNPEKFSKTRHKSVDARNVDP